MNLKNITAALMGPSPYDRLNPGIIHMLNPQPLPPGPPDPESNLSNVLHLGDEVSLNPQPLPPEPTPERSLTYSAISRFNAVALNPQPLPPGPPDPERLSDSFQVIRAKAFSMLEW